MATITQVICDKCRSTTNVSTIDWEIGSETGQIDLCGSCLRTALRSVTIQSKTAGSGRATYAEIRAWAREQGMTVPDKGRLPTEVIQAYSSRKHSAPPLEAIS